MSGSLGRGTAQWPEPRRHASHLGEIDCRICHKIHKDQIDYCSQCHGPLAEGLGWVTPKQ